MESRQQTLVCDVGHEYTEAFALCAVLEYVSGA